MMIKVMLKRNMNCDAWDGLPTMHVALTMHDQLIIIIIHTSTTLVCHRD